jgi:hypothetical protein
MSDCEPAPENLRDNLSSPYGDLRETQSCDIPVQADPLTIEALSISGLGLAHRSASSLRKVNIAGLAAEFRRMIEARCFSPAICRTGFYRAPDRSGALPCSTNTNSPVGLVQPRPHPSMRDASRRKVTCGQSAGTRQLRPARSRSHALSAPFSPRLALRNASMLHVPRLFDMLSEINASVTGRS